MKNKAKCKLCQSIIESFHATDYVICKCGEIAVDGGEGMVCFAKNFSNFLRIDDEGNEITVTIKKAHEMHHGYTVEKEEGWPTNPQSSNDDNKKYDLIKELEEMIKSIESLPKQAMYEPVTQCELASVLMLLSAILRS